MRITRKENTRYIEWYPRGYSFFSVRVFKPQRMRSRQLHERRPASIEIASFNMDMLDLTSVKAYSECLRCAMSVYIQYREKGE
jgi:hypothetical protein